ncbi:MAG: hypothetical protein ACNA8J_00680 [Gammaproteobacteria bacterium]
MNALRHFALSLALLSSSAWAVLPFENTGRLYVSIWNEDIVKVFSQEGELLDVFTAPGLEGPRGIAFNPTNGDIWLAGEHSNTVYVFDKNHRLKRVLEHPDFLEPVGISFRHERGHALEVYISNSGNASIDPDKGNEIMVFSPNGKLLRRFSHPDLKDPNCSAFLPDGSYFVTNRLQHRVDYFDAGDNFVTSFSYVLADGSPGLLSTMAVARDPQKGTIWATGGGGPRAIVEFDLDGNILTVIDQATLRDVTGDENLTITPQGIAFDENGNFTVASFDNQVFRFNNDGELIWIEDEDGTERYAYRTGTGNSRSIALEPVRPVKGPRR